MCTPEERQCILRLTLAQQLRAQAQEIHKLLVTHRLPTFSGLVITTIPSYQNRPPSTGSTGHTPARCAARPKLAALVAARHSPVHSPKGPARAARLIHNLPHRQR